MEEKDLWLVEKFIPLFCPRCNHKFGKQDKDFKLFFGDIIEESKVPRITPGYDIIVCVHCDNYTTRVWLQRKSVETLQEAELLVQKDGFTNPQEVRGFGSHAKPRTIILNREIIGPLIIHSHWLPDEEDLGKNKAS